jgi:hypothetical protein
MLRSRWPVLIFLAACGDDGNATKDAAIDGGACGANAPITGEVVDWDANNTTFCGVFNAKLTVRADPSLSDSTNPNGRFELCVPRAAQVPLDIAYATTPSECTSPKEAYPVPGVAIVLADVPNRSLLFSARAMTPTRQASMFTQIGQAYDAAKGQLVVHLVGTAAKVTVDAAHAASQAWSGATWAAGDTGSDVFLPNLTPGSVQITVAGAAALPKVDVVAGKYTYVTVAAAAAATGGW